MPVDIRELLKLAAKEVAGTDDLVDRLKSLSPVCPFYDSASELQAVKECPVHLLHIPDQVGVVISFRFWFSWNG